MTSSPDPTSYSAEQYEIMRRDRDFHRRRADALGNELTRLRTENTALIDAVNGHLDTIHKDAEDLREATRALGEKEMELREARGAAVATNREAQRLRDANTELHRQLSQRDTPPGSYLIRSPGVYVATNDENDPLGGLHVVKHPHRDAVVLTAHPDAEPAQWWQLYRDGLTGNLAAWHPPMGLHDLIAATAKAYQDPSAQPWMGIDPGNGDDLTTVMQTTLTRLARLEQQMVTKLTEISHPSQQMFERLARLEAWARQFPRTNIGEVHTNGAWLRGTNLIEPLDSMGDKA